MKQKQDVWNILGKPKESMINDIEEKLEKVQKLVQKYNPEELITALHSANEATQMLHFTDFMAGKTGLELNDVAFFKSLEWFQTILLFQKNDENKKRKNINSLQKDSMVIRDYVNEISSLNSFIVLDEIEDEHLAFNQLMQMNVNGKIYPYLMKKFFFEIFKTFREFIMDTYGITVEDLVNGIKSISDCTLLSDPHSIDAMMSEGEEQKSLFLEFMDKYNVQSLTQWSTEFIDDLSVEIGSIDSMNDGLPWTFKTLPIKSKPFIKINNKYYCFAGINLTDNIYRNLYNSLVLRNQDLKQKLNELQKITTENYALKLLSKLLPGAEIFDSVEYKAPTGKLNKRNWCETDGVIVFDDVVIVVEVKGGNLSPVTPLESEVYFENTISSLTTAPYLQGKRFYNEFKDKNEINLFKRNGKERELIKTIRNIGMFLVCSITIDEFNDIAAKIEKTKYVPETDFFVWNISLFDLVLYPEIFNSSSMFLNYLYQRSKVKNVAEIILHDEIDHLGLFLAHNDYSSTLENLVKSEPDITTLEVMGYREEIDFYMLSLTNMHIPKEENFFNLMNGNVAKPKQNMPPLFEEIIKRLERGNNSEKVRMTRYLLMLDSETRGNMNHLIEHARNRVKTKNLKATYGAFNYVEEHRIADLPIFMIFVDKPNSPIFKQRHVLRDFLLERVFTITEDVHCIVIGIGNDSKIKKLEYINVTPSMFQSKSPEILEKIMIKRDKISRNRTITPTMN